MSLTIAYCSSRREPEFQWFLDSLAKQLKNHQGLEWRIVFVDFWHPRSLVADRIVHVPPKPNVWNGEHRLTRQDWFAAANARNTALCYAPDGLIIYVDDLSVLLPGWLDAALATGNDITCGAYKKVKDLVVEDGLVKSFTPYPAGEDNRLKHVTADATPCGGQWAYGCSLAGPVEAFLSVNGWPEDLCGGLGFEDVVMGLVMENAGWKFKYDRRMMTYESEEGHHVTQHYFRKEDYHKNEKGEFVVGGNGKDDKSHAVLNIARQSKYFPNSFGEGGIRELRRRTLAGEPFPIPASPQHEWFTGKLLMEL